MVKRVVTFKIDEYELDKLDRLANILGTCRSELIREAIALLLKYYEVKESFGKVEKVRLY